MTNYRLSLYSPTHPHLPRLDHDFVSPSDAMARTYAKAQLATLYPYVTTYSNAILFNVDEDSHVANLTRRVAVTVDER